MGKPMITVDALQSKGKPCVELHNYYINNYKSNKDIYQCLGSKQFWRAGISNAFIVSSAAQIGHAICLGVLMLSH
jgi:hypothetical protein